METVYTWRWLVIPKVSVLFEIVLHLQIMCGMEEMGDTWKKATTVEVATSALDTHFI
jgi:hypothetical protein